MLIGPQEPAHALLAQVIGLVRLAQHGELAAAALPIGFELGGLVVDDVLMLDRNCRNVQSEQPPHLARVISRRKHEMLGNDVASLRGTYPPFPRLGAFGADRLGVLVNLGTGAARAFAQRHGEVGRRDVAVIRVIERADDRRSVGPASELEQRPQLLHTLRCDYLEGNTDRIRGAAVLVVLVHARAAGCQAQISRDMKAHVLTGLGRQPLVEVDRVLVQLPDGVTHIEERQQPRGMPRGARGELAALDERHVRPAFPGQVIERAHPDRAAADHQDPNMRLHGSLSSCNRVSWCQSSVLARAASARNRDT